LHSERALRVRGKLVPVHSAHDIDATKSQQAVELAEVRSYLDEDIKIPAQGARAVAIRIPAIESEQHLGFVELAITYLYYFEI